MLRELVVKPISFIIWLYNTIKSTLDLLNWICPPIANSADPDLLASEEANRSGSALFVILYVNVLSTTWIKQTNWRPIKSG